MPLQVKRTTREAPRYMYIPTPTLCPKLPLAYGYTNGLDTMRAVYIIQPRGIYCCLVFDLQFRKLRSFDVSKPKRSKRLSICLVTHTTHPQGMVARVTSAKLVQTARKSKSYLRNIAKYNTMRTPDTNDEE